LSAIAQVVPFALAGAIIIATVVSGAIALMLFLLRMDK
jgi:hypothetical protein